MDSNLGRQRAMVTSSLTMNTCVLDLENDIHSAALSGRPVVGWTVSTKMYNDSVLIYK